MQWLSIPRPNGSRAERETTRRMRDWLEERGVPHRVERFPHYPYFFECLGIWLIALPTLLATGVWLRWGWPLLPLALGTLVGAALDMALHLHLVTWPGRRQGENLLIELGAANPARELVVSAHYDSKTELLDHRRRLALLKALPGIVILVALIGASGPLDAWLSSQGSPWSERVHLISQLMTIPVLGFSWALGVNLAVGRLLEPSQGAVDNGAACAILLGLADELAHGSVDLQDARVTLALFSGEEVNLQGSRSYVRARAWDGAEAALNLEAMAQNGPYVLWERDGSLFRLRSTSATLNRAIQDVVRDVSSKPVLRAGPLISDCGSFLAAGVPATTLGTHDRELGDRGLHRPSDSLERVVPERILEAVHLLRALVTRFVGGEVKLT